MENYLINISEEFFPLQDETKIELLIIELSRKIIQINSVVQLETAFFFLGDECLFKYDFFSQNISFSAVIISLMNTRELDTSLTSKFVKKFFKRIGYKTQYLVWYEDLSEQTEMFKNGELI